MSTQSRNRAVVLGGSVAGLLAAGVLAETYDLVTIVERDPLPADTAQRRGVPHGQHVHGLLPRGCQLMEELLPGLTADLVAAGALVGDIVGNVRWYLQGRLLRQPNSGLVALSASRPLIEGTVRAHVRACPNVTVLDGHDIVGLHGSTDRIVGVRATSLHGHGSRLLPADLVVDATGRGSRTSRWLSELGLAPAPEERVGIDLTYATRVFSAPPELLGDNVVVSIARFPGQRRSAVLQRLEDGHVLVTLAGILGERPPAELGAFIEYAATLPSSEARDVARLSEPRGEARTFRVPTYTRHRYERMAPGEFPAGLLVVGDAFCNLNPVYGQGMTVAAQHATALRDELREHAGAPDATRVFAAAARALDAPWALAVGADLAVAGVTGPQLPSSPLTPEYMGRLQIAATVQDEVAEAFIRVTALVDPPSALLAPGLVERVEQVHAALATRV